MTPRRLNILWSSSLQPGLLIRLNHMNSRFGAIQLFVKRWLISRVPSRTFASSNVKYSNVPRESPNEDESQYPFNDASVSRPTKPRLTGELERRARVLQAWQRRLEGEQEDEEIANGLERAGESEARASTNFRSIWLPGRPVVRKMKIDETDAAIAGAVRYYLKPRKGKAAAKAAEQAAKDPILQYALSPDYIRYRGASAEKALDEAFQIGNERSAVAASMPRKKRPKQTVVPGSEEDMAARRRQAESDRQKSLQSNGHVRRWQMLSSSLSFHAAFHDWREAHEPEPTHVTHNHTRRALKEIRKHWVEFLNTRFSAQQIHEFDCEVSVFNRVMNERHYRKLEQNYPRIYLQNVLLRSCLAFEKVLKDALLLLDNFLEADPYRNSSTGKDLEDHAQKFDSYIVDIAAMANDVIHLVTRYVENLSDEELARKVQSFSALAASASLVYFDPAKYSGTIDPVFWPRGPRSGI